MSEMYKAAIKIITDHLNVIDTDSVASFKFDDIDNTRSLKMKLIDGTDIDVIISKKSLTGLRKWIEVDRSNELMTAICIEVNTFINTAIQYNTITESDVMCRIDQITSMLPRMSYHLISNSDGSFVVDKDIKALVGSQINNIFKSPMPSQYLNNRFSQFDPRTAQRIFQRESPSAFHNVFGNPCGTELVTHTPPEVAEDSEAPLIMIEPKALVAEINGYLETHFETMSDNDIVCKLRKHLVKSDGGEITKLLSDIFTKDIPLTAIVLTVVAVSDCYKKSLTGETNFTLPLVDSRLNALKSMVRNTTISRLHKAGKSASEISEIMNFSRMHVQTYIDRTKL